MKKYEEGDWIIDKKGRAYNQAFKLTPETSLWYAHHDKATQQEVEKAVHSDIYWKMRMLHQSMLKEVFRGAQTLEQASEWVEKAHLRIQNELKAELIN